METNNVIEGKEIKSNKKQIKASRRPIKSGWVFISSIGDASIFEENDKYLVTLEKGANIVEEYFDDEESAREFAKEITSSFIRSARYIIEDEWGEVIAEADTYEEAQSVGGARIFDTIKSSRRVVKSSIDDVKTFREWHDMIEDRLSKAIAKEGYRPNFVWNITVEQKGKDWVDSKQMTKDEFIDYITRQTGLPYSYRNRINRWFKEINQSRKLLKSSSDVGSIHDRYVLGDITETMALQELKKLVGLKKAKTMLDKWQQTYVLSTRINSSIDKAVREAEDYFGTEASDRTISCQDILTTKDNEEMYDIAERNNVEVKIGRFSVTFYEKEDVGLED